MLPPCPLPLIPEVDRHPRLSMALLHERPSPPDEGTDAPREDEKDPVPGR